MVVGLAIARPSVRLTLVSLTHCKVLSSQCATLLARKYVHYWKKEEEENESG